MFEKNHAGDAEEKGLKVHVRRSRLQAGKWGVPTCSTFWVSG